MQHGVLLQHGITPTGYGLFESYGRLYVLSDCCGGVYIYRSNLCCEFCYSPLPTDKREPNLRVTHCNELFLQQWVEDWTGLKDVKVQINP